MLRIFLATFLIAGICVYTTPIQAQQTSEELQAAFKAELTEYATTHNDDELRAYAAMRMSELSDQNVETQSISPMSLLYRPKCGTECRLWTIDRVISGQGIQAIPYLGRRIYIRSV